MKGPDIAKIGLLLHVYAYSIFESITKVLGVAQAVLLNDFAKAFLNLGYNIDLKIESVKNYISLLKDIGVVRKCRGSGFMTFYDKRHPFIFVLLHPFLGLHLVRSV